MDILGIDVCKQRLDVALLLGERCRHSVFANTEAGFAELLSWLSQHRPGPEVPLHACMEATGNWGLDLAEVLHGAGMTVSIVNPSRVKAYGQSELARNKTDKLDAALIARFCRAHRPATWTRPAAHLRELRELMRGCDSLKAMRVQEINRQKSGTASATVATSIAAHLEWLDQQIEETTAVVRVVVAGDPVLERNHALMLTIPGIGPVTAATMLAEVPNSAGFTQRHWRPSPACRRRSIVPDRRSAGQDASAAWDRSACAGRST